VERAVRAALEMQAVMPEVNRYVKTVLEGEGVAFLPLTQRIGVNYGHVFAGNVGSEREGGRREYTVMGDTVNLAARLMVATEEGDILVSPSVRRRVADKFKLEDLAPISVKGKAQPIPVSRTVRPLTESERVALRRGRRLFIGRTAQLEAIKAAARQTLSGQGQVVVVVGETGTGKTRLVEAFQEHLDPQYLISDSEQLNSSSLNCYVTELPSYAQEPYAPIVNLLRRVIGLGGQAVEDVGQLREWVQKRAPNLAHFMPLLGALLALPIPDNPVTASLTPEQRRDRLFDLVEAVLYSEARLQPLALAVDDLQWGDDSSLALLNRLTRGVVTAPLLLVLCYRPDVTFPTPWAELSHTHTVQVAEFSREESDRLVAGLLETDELPEGLAEMVWDRAQGNPFFTEEFVKSLRETGVILYRDSDERDAGGGGWQLVPSGTNGVPSSIPDTIEDIVLARLDRLEARCRELLQEASVAAASQPRFARLLLARVDPHPPSLHQRLQNLTNEGLLETLESELEALEYHFRHTLTRDVAYDSLLYARRRELHFLIAQGVEALYTDRLDEYVHSLAHHYLEAGKWQQAFAYVRRAGERAQALFANKDAIVHFQRALEVATEHLPGASMDDLIDVHDHLGDVLLIEGRYDEALAAFRTARGLLTQDGPPDLVTRFYRKTAEVYERKADYPLALEWLERGLEILEGQDVVEKARIYNFGGGVFYRQGEREKALEWRQRALEIAERLGDQSEIANAYLLMAIIYSDWGDTDRALAFGRRCLEAYGAAGDLVGSVKARVNAGLISRRADDWAQAAEHYREGLRLSERMGDWMRIGMLANNMGEVYLDQGKLDEAAAAYQRSIAVLEPRGFLGGVAILRLNLGKVAILQDRLEAGEAYLADALALAQEIGARRYLPEIFRWQALLYQMRGQYEEALDLAKRALELAQELNDRKETGGALRVLGQVYADLDQSEKAIEHLQASLACFAELKSAYEAAKTCHQLALVYVRQPGKKEEGQALLEQTCTLFAELGARWDLAQAEKAIERFLA
jgi:tetratricopeptide (TPR) repeat protein